MTDETKTLHESWLAKQAKLKHARVWLDQTLREGGGPHDNGTAVLVVHAIPLPDDPTTANLMVRCLPDISIEHLIAALERFTADLKAGNYEHTPLEEPEFGASSDVKH